jgi:mono/diheme cytochrome c family protein
MEWFPQMKEQPAVQALENRTPLVPPEGTIPAGGITPRLKGLMPAFLPQAMMLPNPVSASPESVTRGKEVYRIYCMVCHGEDGTADLNENPVARRLAESQMPPLPLISTPDRPAATLNYPDGLIFTKIRYGRPGMPGYPQIAPEDRWHVVNYLRSLLKVQPQQEETDQ